MKVLIADDCASTLEILRHNLTKWGYEPLLVSDGEQALRVLRSPAGPRLALLDWNMPKLEGTDVCRELRSRAENALNYTYVILLTAKRGDKNLVEALESGADDYLRKPVSPRELQLRVRSGERIVELQDRVVRMNRKLAVISTHDQLTNSLNRSATMDRLKQEMERTARTNRKLTYISLDIDQFEEVNHRYGFTFGDEILKQMAERFKGAIRSFDILGRIGGEEFGVILPDCDLGTGVGLAERLRGCIKNQPFLVDKEAISITISVGVASSSEDEIDRKPLVNGAEKSLRQAKADGGDRVLMWEKGLVMDPLNLARTSGQ